MKREKSRVQHKNDCWKTKNSVVEKEVLVLPVVAVRCHIARSHGCKLEFSGSGRVKRRRKRTCQISSAVLNLTCMGSLPQVKRAEVLENVLAAGILLRKIDHLRRLLEAGGQHLTKSSGMSELFPTVHAMAKKDLLDLRLAQPGAPGVSTCTMPGTTTPSSSMVLPVKAKLSPSLFASSTNSGRLFNVLSGLTSLPSPLQALSYRRYLGRA